MKFLHHCDYFSTITQIISNFDPRINCGVFFRTLFSRNPEKHTHGSHDSCGQ